MIPLLFIAFAILMVIGAPLGVALGLSGTSPSTLPTWG